MVFATGFPSLRPSYRGSPYRLLLLGKPTMYIQKIILGTCLLVCTANCLAEETPATAQPPEFTIITATRTSVKDGMALPPTTLLTREDIQRLQARSLEELMSRIPGAQFARTGGRGGDTALFLRGTNRDHTSVLINGMYVNSVTGFGYPLSFLDPDLIERVEVVRGPRSTLYGSGAIGGVVHIITRTPQRDISRIRAGIGSNRTSEGALHLTRNLHPGTVSLDLSHYGTQGVDDTLPDNGDRGDRDAFRNRSAKISLYRKFGDKATLRLDALRTNGEDEYDPDPGIFCDPVGCDDAEEITGDIRRLGAYTLNWTHLIGEHWTTRLNLGRADEEWDGQSIMRDFFTNAPARSEYEYDLERDSVSWQNDIRMENWGLLSAGADYYRETADIGGDFPYDEERDNLGLFLQYQVQWGRQHLTLGFRNEDNEQYGSHNTGNIDWGWNLSEEMMLILSWGEAFVAPSFADLYFPGFSNPELAPEESRNYEIQLRREGPTLQWAVSLFHNEVDNLIEFDSTRFIPVNRRSILLRGAELEIETTLEKWNIALSLAYLDPENRADGSVLARRSRRTLYLDLDRDIGPVHIGISWQVADHRTDSDGTRLPGYGIVHARLAWQLTPQWNIRLNLQNLLDQDYTLINNYATEGFNGLISLTYEW